MTSESLLVGVYTDENTLSIEQEFPLSVEDVCKECALQIQIDVSLIQLFSLFHIDRKIWLSPNHLLNHSDCGKDPEYIFRIRFFPEMQIKNDKFIHYLNLQYRHCFTKEFELGGIKKSVLFGLGVFDMITDSYKKGLTRSENVFQSNKYKNFFPEQELNKYNMLQLWFLKNNLRRSVKKKHNEYAGDFRINMMGNTYISKIQNEFYSQIAKEKYKYKDKAGNEKVVTVEEKNSEFMVCFEQESYCLKSVRSVKIRNNRVEIYFSGSSPKMFKMEPEISESFVSAMDGLYRLAYNYHYGICDDVLSPRIKKLQKLGCYDHIKEEIAINILTKADQEGSFLIRIRENVTDTFDVFALGSENSKVVKFTVGPNESLQSLQETHTNLQHQLKPKHFEWCDLLFCHKPASPPESANPQLDTNNKVFLSSEISFTEEKPFHIGIFTEIYKGKLKGCKTPVSITTLRDFPESHLYTQVFMTGISSMLEMCKCPCFLQVKGVIMEPNFGLVTEFPSQRVVSYLSSNDQLPLVYILEMAYTVAEGLEFLREQGIVHGDISCENLQMIDVNTVKITDASIVNMVYLLPKDNIIYKSRLPWLEPQLQNNQSKPTFESDIFSYGTTLCQMLCLLCKPPPPLQQDQASYEAPCRLLFNISEDEDKAQKANYVRKQLHELILMCRSKKMEDRPQPFDISTKLRELIHEPINQERLPTDSPRNSLCNHAWNNPPILPEDIPNPIKVIQNNSLKLKVPKSAPVYEINSKYLKRERKIGAGAYGEVFLATYYTQDNERVVALKTFLQDEQTTSELEILHKLEHERIVEIVGFCPGMGIVLEYVKGGDLRSKLTKSHTLIPNIKNILLQITEGMKYLQIKKIIHRDLAARNILLTENDDVKITDFGLSKLIEDEDYKVKTSRGLPLHWCSPEQVERISSKSDVWSFGVVMWECYSCGAQPILVQERKFSALHAALKAGNRLSKPKHCTEAMYEIMEKCWRFQPIDRPDFRTLEVWFQNAA